MIYLLSFEMRHNKHNKQGSPTHNRGISHFLSGDWKTLKYLTPDDECITEK